jgi:hypothetical protein
VVLFVPQSGKTKVCAFGLRCDMKIIFLLSMSFLSIVMTNAWCQTPIPSGPGDTLKRSQDTMEYYQLERKLQKDRQRLGEEKASSHENSGNQEEFDIHDEDNDVIQYNDPNKSENKD